MGDFYQSAGDQILFIMHQNHITDLWSHIRFHNDNDETFDSLFRILILQLRKRKWKCGYE